MFFFHIPKREKYIRMVYDGIILNLSLYSTWFVLPTIDTFAWKVIVGNWYADNNYGNMFFNFPLHPDLHKF